MTKQLKRTPKKKSAPSSRTSKQPELRIFDTPNARVIARVESTTPTAFIVSWLGQLTFRPVPVKGGESFKLLASIANPITPKLYELERSAVRGSFLNDNANIELLYNQYVERCEAGYYHLNPYAAPTDGELQQGDGKAETVETEVNELRSNEPEPTPPTESAPTPSTDDAPAAPAEVPSNDA